MASKAPTIGRLPAPLANVIDRVLDSVRAELAHGEPDEALLARIRQLLLGAVQTRDSFTLENFPLDPQTRDAVYLLSEDPDHRLALYLGMRDCALSTPVHNHRTWACIVGIHGRERNRFYRRVSGGLREIDSVDVVPGAGVAMASEDLHSISTEATVLNMQLHLYGRSFEAQEGRVMIDPQTGEERRFAGHPEMQIPHGRVTPAMLKRMIHDGDELAVLDLRPAVEHHQHGHPLVATSFPLDRLAEDLPRRIPNRKTRIVLLADEETIGEANKMLDQAGYSPPFYLPGGANAWSRSGYPLFEGVNVPSKAFGEFLEHASKTPVISATALASLKAAQQPHVLIDCRTHAEHRRMTIPGSINLPGAESLTRIRTVVTDPGVPIIVHCAGRTRGLLAAQILRDAGCPNPIAALENGLIGWLLAGQTMEIGGGRPVPDHSSDALPGAEAAVPRIKLSKLNEWLNDSSRTTYVFDVRSADEFATGHLAQAQWVPSGELLQQIDAWIAVRRSRVVITGEDCRARAVATLLSRMDWCETALLAGEFPTVRGSAPERPAIPRGWRPPFDEHEQDSSRMRAYIEWELGLLEKLADDGSLSFR